MKEFIKNIRKKSRGKKSTAFLLAMVLFSCALLQQTYGWGTEKAAREQTPLQQTAPEETALQTAALKGAAEPEALRKMAQPKELPEEEQRWKDMEELLKQQEALPEKQKTPGGAWDGELRSPEEIQTAEISTPVGKVSEDMQQAYELLKAAYEGEKDYPEQIRSFGRMLQLAKKEVEQELEKEGSRELQSALQAGFARAEELAGRLGTGQDEETLAALKELLCPEPPFVSLGSSMPFGKAKEPAIRTEAVKEGEEEEGQAAAYRPEASPYRPEDLVQTNDTIVSDALRKAFEEDKTPLELFRHVKNLCLPEFYYGSRKGALGTFEQKAGNAFDQASLLIGLLRDRKIPARYVRGEIEIPVRQLQSWTGTKDVHAALRQLACLGIPHTAFRDGEQYTTVRLEHVWVEAYLPYTQYRGAEKGTGESLWVPLDPGMKEVRLYTGVDLSAAQSYVQNPENAITEKTEIAGVPIGELSGYVQGENSAFVKYMLENGYGSADGVEAFGGRKVVESNPGYLPLTTPYKVHQVLERFTDIPRSLTDTIRFSLESGSALIAALGGGKEMETLFEAPDLYGKRLLLDYVPASEKDRETIAKYGDIFRTPAYLVQLKPRLLLDGKTVAEGKAIGAGTSQKYRVILHNGAPGREDGDVSNLITAGGMYHLAFNYGTVPAERLQASADELEKLKETATRENLYTDACMGKVLQGVAGAYFAQSDLFAAIVEGQQQVRVAKELSMGVVGFGANSVSMFLAPVELKESGLFLDIGHDIRNAVSNHNDAEAEKAYMLQAGIYGSAMEHLVLEQATGVESVSTIKVFSYAARNNIPLHVITKENLQEELQVLRVSDGIKEEIKTGIARGRMIIIPEETVAINRWSGSGYMVLDPDSFSCGYMISGGLAGGSMTEDEMLDEYLKQLKSGLFWMVVTYAALIAAVLFLPAGALTVLTAIGSYIGILLKYAVVLTVLQYTGLYLVTKDPAYLQKLLIELAVLLTLQGASAIGNFALSRAIEYRLRIEDLSKKIGCFIAGTLVFTSVGLMPIESVAAGDLVKSFDPDTGIVSEQLVEETFIKESSELVHVRIGTETITATTNHPFYVPQKGFVEAIQLRAGDRLQTVNGEYVIVEQVQHEILESPVKVYNFRVANNHTYYVGENAVGVHNNNPCAGEDFKSSVPNPNGKKGGLAHQNTVKSIKKTSANGDIEYEKRYATPNGYKQSRYADAVEIVDGNVTKIHQVGKVNQNGTPKTREAKAIEDIMNSPDYNGAPIYFWPYNNPDMGPIIFDF